MLDRVALLLYRQPRLETRPQHEFADALEDLRLGVNIIETRSLASQMSARAQEALAAMFAGLAVHFRALARGRVAPLGDDLLQKIDLAIGEVAACGGSTSPCVAAVVGLRRTLYPDAPSYRPMQIPGSSAGGKVAWLLGSPDVSVRSTSVFTKNQHLGLAEIQSAAGLGYGIPDPDPVEVDRLLAQFRLLDKTRLALGEFNTVDLSTGQRKRLALIVSLLEKRPILLLDEWAADQDPDFRRKFYFDLLPALHQAGVTVVVVTHDDRYLDEMDLAARRLRMDEGRFVDQRSVENG
jgi:Fusaric acid resistance protein family/ABC transporter